MLHEVAVISLASKHDGVAIGPRGRRLMSLIPTGAGLVASITERRGNNGKTVPCVQSKLTIIIEVGVVLETTNLDPDVEVSMADVAQDDKSASLQGVSTVGLVDLVAVRDVPTSSGEAGALLRRGNRQGRCSRHGRLGRRGSGGSGRSSLLAIGSATEDLDDLVESRDLSYGPTLVLAFALFSGESSLGGSQVLVSPDVDVDIRVRRPRASGQVDGRSACHDQEGLRVIVSDFHESTSALRNEFAGLNLLPGVAFARLALGSAVARRGHGRRVVPVVELLDHRCRGRLGVGDVAIVASVVVLNVGAAAAEADKRTAEDRAHEGKVPDLAQVAHVGDPLVPLNGHDHEHEVHNQDDRECHTQESACNIR